MPSDFEDRSHEPELWSTAQVRNPISSSEDLILTKILFEYRRFAKPGSGQTEGLASEQLRFHQAFDRTEGYDAKWLNYDKFDIYGNPLDQQAAKL
jgi:hypothetical protein